MDKKRNKDLEKQKKNFRRWRKKQNIKPHDSAEQTKQKRNNEDN